MIRYDTEKMRKAAGKIKSTAAIINDVAESKARSIQNTVPSALQGDAGDALNEAVEVLRREIASLVSSLNSLSSTLTQYADTFEEADNQVSNLISGH